MLERERERERERSEVVGKSEREIETEFRKPIWIATQYLFKHSSLHIVCFLFYFIFVILVNLCGQEIKSN